MMFFIFFFFILFISNVIQGITGFAGTLLAMPFLLYLMDIEPAKEILNFVGLIGSLVIVYNNHQYINFSHVRRIIFFMMIEMVTGIVSYSYLSMKLLMIIFSTFLLFTSVHGLVKVFQKKVKTKQVEMSIKGNTILLLGGFFHGMFLSGGPLLVMFASDYIPEKRQFRATLSCVWVILNGFYLLQSLLNKNISVEV